MFSPMSRARLMGFGVLLAVAALDQWSKATVLSAAQSFDLPRQILPFFGLVLVHNRGISFGLLGQMSAYLPLLLTLFTSAVAIGLTVWLARTNEPGTALGLGLVVGGAVGNIIDRLRFGSVTDFIDFHIAEHHWPAFNIADSAICMGVVLLILISIVGPAHQKEETK